MCVERARTPMFSSKFTVIKATVGNYSFEVPKTRKTSLNEAGLTSLFLRPWTSERFVLVLGIGKSRGDESWIDHLSLPCSQYSLTCIYFLSPKSITRNINFLLTISIQNQEKRLWELIKWPPRGKWFDLFSNSQTKCKEISVENLLLRGEPFNSALTSVIVSRENMTVTWRNVLQTTK